MNRFDEMRQCIQEAERTLRAADSRANDMARLLKGRLRHCSPSALTELKRELRDFNMYTGRWIQ